MARGEKLEIMRMVHEHYRMDIEQIWKRGTVYLTISSALFALISSKDFVSDVSKSIFVLFGLVISGVWFINAVLSYRWIGVWRRHLVRIDSEINPFRSFSEGEGSEHWLWSHVKRPQTYALALPLASIILWANLWPMTRPATAALSAVGGTLGKQGEAVRTDWKASSVQDASTATSLPHPARP